MEKINLNNLATEKNNPNSQNIDKVSTLEMLKIINNQDKLVASTIEKVIPNIALAIDRIVLQLNDDGRLIYMGAGTSGRLGVLDASECPPTYGVSKDLIQGIIAGGESALTNSIENAEDNKELAVADLKNIGFNSKDVLVGIAASGRTPYVISAIEYAKSIGSKTIAIACCANSIIGNLADIKIEAEVGPEVITGSTRMKAGTAQKMILNMLSTGSMIKLGKVYNNLMVDVAASNLKLIERAKKIFMEATGKTYSDAEKLLSANNYNVKLAILISKTGITAQEGTEALKDTKGHLHEALELVYNKTR